MTNAEDWAEIDEWWPTLVNQSAAQNGNANLRNITPGWGNDLWAKIDPWWTEYTEALTATLHPSDSLKLSDGQHNEFAEVEHWWRAYEEAFPSTLRASDEWKLSGGEKNGWLIVDPWWETYAEEQQARKSELIEAVEELNTEWERSLSRFDQDPLIKDITPGGRALGPLRITHEEDWSHWLADLIRSSSGAFTHQLFGEEFDSSPELVRREVRFHDPTDSDRRIDVLAMYESGGASIEIKIDDDNYYKTLHTASLIEEERTGEWTHILLLPKYNSSKLKYTFPERLARTDDGDLMIESSQSTNIQIVYWEDIAHLLRLILLADDESDSHWDASAYLFVSMIEQHIRSLTAVSSWNQNNEQKDTSDDEIPVAALRILNTTDISAQISHIKRTLEEIQ